MIAWKYFSISLLKNSLDVLHFFPILGIRNVCNPLVSSKKKKKKKGEESEWKEEIIGRL